MIKVMLVDDHELVRCGIQALLETSTDISVVSMANSGEDAIKKVREIVPDVILLDVNMPGIGGLETCRRILQKHPAIHIIALSSLVDGPIPKQVINIGAKGFISKTCSADEMLRAIKQVMDGRPFISSEVATNMALSAITNNEKSPFDKLSAREAEVVCQVLQGKNIQEMSQMMSISDKTVNTYRYRIYNKLNVKNDVELTRMAVKFNFIDSSLI